MSRFVVFLALLACTSACFRQLEEKRKVRQVLDTVRDTLPDCSFEVYDFKVGWYNEWVDPKFNLAYDNDTVALSILTIPGIFEDSFTPFLCANGSAVFNDTWDKLMEFYMGKVRGKLLENLQMDVPVQDVLYSNAMIAPGHPVVLVQIANHVAGAAYYYQRKDVTNDPWPKNKTIYGASLHPKYGGWFLMGPVIILEGVKYADMPRKQPKDVLVTDAKKIEFLNEVNFDWRTQKWRNIIPVEKKYSKDHLNYSMTYGKQRIAWVEQYYKDKCLWRRRK